MPEPPKSRVTELLVSGMDCSNCVRHVTEAIQSVPGVHSARVDLQDGRAVVRWVAGARQDVAALVEAVSEAGYSAQERRRAEGESAEHDGDEHHAVSGWQLNLWVGVVATALLMAGEWVFSLGMNPVFRWLSFALATVVQVVAGAQFYRGAWQQLKSGRSNMDTLVALGSTTAYAYSVWVLFSGGAGHLYFMEAAAIITLISLGHWMEARVSVKASSALRELLTLAPQTARRIESADGKEVETEVPVARLRVGDRVVLRPGDRVPTDGEVVEGSSAVDEAMLTGESVPVEKSAGSALYAGTVNASGRLIMRVTAVGEETALAHIIAAVQRAQSSRANIQRLGDRVSSVFVPVVVVIALVAGLWWALVPESAMRVHDALARFLWEAHPPLGGIAAGVIVASAVLIIACPCAMGLATPVAIMAGSNSAAKRGILIRDAIALEKAGDITAVVFDKTGTLTEGRPKVAAVHESLKAGEILARLRAASAEASWTDVRGLGAALAVHSQHPISRSIAEGVSSGRASFSNWREERGAGVEAELPGTGERVRLGAVRWLRESGVDLSRDEGFLKEWSAKGATIVGLAVASELVGLFAVRDGVKPGAVEVVRRLRDQGLETYLVTGDNALTASSIASQVGIRPENVYAEVRPERKAEFVGKLQMNGARVAFIGDGINDAPALEWADLGIAVSRASDVAREAADMILLRSEIEAVPEALGLARATLRTIRQNLFWAFFYNGAGVPLAALGFMSPILCAAAMGISDLIVIGNALRLRGWRLA
ncbi:MAG TPA: cation-translocating P-type ATPase [Verrucomicrobia bacterium]|nr:cation-translocating P-type ATPase [Verrucomicrobiota bacterium]